MTYTVEDVNQYTKKISFSFENPNFDKEISEELKKKQKNLQLKGFRKGKAPFQLVEKMYAGEVREKAFQKFFHAKFVDCIKEENLEVLGTPIFTNPSMGEEKKMGLEAIVEVFPEVEVKDLAGETFKMESTEVSEEELEKVKKSRLESKSVLVEKEEGVAAENGLFVVINFKGFSVPENEEIPNTTSKEHLLELGSKSFIPGFEEGIVGMKAGEKKDLMVTFPEDYQAEDLKGKEVKFEVEVLEIKEKQFPEVSEVVKDFGHETEEAWVNSLKEELTKEKENNATKKLHEDLVNKLVELNEFEVSPRMIDEQKQMLEDQLNQVFKAQGMEGMSQEYKAKWEEDLNQRANFQVKSALLLENLGRKYNITATMEDLDEKCKEMANEEMSFEDVKKYYTKDGQMTSKILYALREEKIIEN